MNEKEREFYHEYLCKGYDLSRAKHYAKQKYDRWIVSSLKQTRPEVYARVQEQLAREREERARQEREMQEARIRAERVRQSRAEVLKMYSMVADCAVMCTNVPIPPLERGTFVAFRSWVLQDDGRLHGVGIGSSYAWREVNFADRPPSETNEHGLYAVRIDPQGLIMGGTGGFLNKPLCGLVTLGGTVVEHDDGWLRAEYAKLECIWYMKGGVHPYYEVPLLAETYPTTPIYVCTQRQAIDALFIMAAMGAIRQ